MYFHNEPGDLGKVFFLGLCFENAERKCEIQARPIHKWFCCTIHPHTMRPKLCLSGKCFYLGCICMKHNYPAESRVDNPKIDSRSDLKFNWKL